MQTINIKIHQGYTPNHVILQVGRPVELNFFREDPDHCLAKLLIPDFAIAVDLSLDEKTSIEFTPIKTGKYVFTCGRGKFQGVIEVLTVEAPRQKQTLSQALLAA